MRISLVHTGLLLVQNLMKLTKADFYIRQVNQHTHRQVMREIKDKHIFNIIVDVHPRNINGFFRSVSESCYVYHQNCIFFYSILLYRDFRLSQLKDK